jgi:hypothetical protein
LSGDLVTLEEYGKMHGCDVKILLINLTRSALYVIAKSAVSPHCFTQTRRLNALFATACTNPSLREFLGYWSQEFRNSATLIDQITELCLWTYICHHLFYGVQRFHTLGRYTSIYFLLWKSNVVNVPGIAQVW